MSSFYCLFSCADADARVDYLTIMPIWEEPRLGLSTTLTGLKSGTFSGLSTRCLTDPPLSQRHDRSPTVEDCIDFLMGLIRRKEAPKERETASVGLASAPSDGEVGELVNSRIQNTDD